MSIVSLATEIGNTLIDTFREEKPLRHSYALIPKDLPIPIIRDGDGTLRCGYDLDFIDEIGVVSLMFEFE